MQTATATNPRTIQRTDALMTHRPAPFISEGSSPMPVTIVCARCQRLVTIKADHAKRGQRWCSMACWIADQQQIEKRCAKCGRAFSVPPSLAARRYCARACAVADRWHPDLFWARVDRTSGYRQPHMDSDCWLWRGAKNRWGYGTVTRHSRDVRAHRLAYELEHGPFDAQAVICHRCDNPSCVRPDHLLLGTHADNIHDCIRKGRRWHQR
jgi:hypothetical protein